MLSINGKKFMNISEAVQWLLDNNALPFQSTANYVADTVIAKSTIINPSPAEIKIGSLVLFADSKVGTVSGLTNSGFMVSQDYTDIGARLNQITDMDIDASQHLIITLANGDTIDAGLVKQVASFSINASQHLIVTYNDGSSQDLGAIFQGDVVVAGTFRQTQPNYMLNITPSVSSPLAISQDLYSKVIVSNNILHIIFNFKVKNTDEVNPATFYTVGSIYASLSADYAEKIIDLEGNDVTEISSNKALITALSAYYSSDVDGSGLNKIDVAVKNNDVANQIFLRIIAQNGLTFTAGEEKYFMGRVSLTLY